MNTHDNIKLPPLPAWMSRYTVPADDFEGGDDRCLEGLMEEYAIEAIKADRKRRGELDDGFEDNDCLNCSGTGEGMYDGQSCAACRGRGFL